MTSTSKLEYVVVGNPPLPTGLHGRVVMIPQGSTRNFAMCRRMARIIVSR